MQISVSGQQMSVGASLQEYVKERAVEVVSKYFENAPSARVSFSKQGRVFVCDIMVNDGTGRGMVIKSNSSGDEVYNSFDAAIIKIEKQLRKYKSKLKDHHKRMKVSQITPESVKYIIAPTSVAEELVEDNPVIVAEKPISVLPLSVSDAVMKMDLEDLPALMFENAKTGKMNVVYYRKDGNISWVDSK
ncbi:MAG: ribosomal subunit interface protein [Rickettsiales bacterium]|nr:MAG: ribosomal subunit interface protein [Rickettsiales bacterium]